MSDPVPGDLIDFIKAIRERVGMSQESVAKCMKIGKDTYRHIEKRKRPLPDFQHGRVEWIRRLLACLKATDAEKERALQLASQEFLGQFADWLDEVQESRKREGEPPDPRAK